MRKLTATCFVVAALLAVFAGGRDASAHAQYKDSTPAKGAILQDPPARVEITFTQDLQRISGSYGIDVNRDRGASVIAGPAGVDDDDRSVMSVPLQPGLEPGRYVVMWKNVSDADGDPAEGAFSFYYDVEPTAVDLANDEQLALIGAEDPTPVPEETEAGEPTSPAGPTVEPTGASPTPSSGAGDGDNDGDDNAVLLIAVVGLAVAAGIAGGAFLVLRNRAG